MAVNIAIVGKDSYIGTSFEKYLEKYLGQYNIKTIDAVTTLPQDMDFSGIDVVFHVAGIAHDIKGNKADELYYKVNYKLALDVAKKARESDVKQFIFMSSMLVYNGCKKTVIDKETEPCAKGSYAQSKLKADLELQQMASKDFAVAVLRPPMVFGKGCKGNFPLLMSLAKKTKIFPNYKNERSMLYIDNLCEFVWLCINNTSEGVFFPQNTDYFGSSDIVKTIAVKNNNKLWFTRVFNWAISLAIALSNTFRKVFQDLKYEKEMSNTFEGKYRVIDNEESIDRSIH